MKNKINPAIGAKLREARERSGMTQLELANKLGYESMQFVSLFERGLSKVPLKVIGKVCVILHLKPKPFIDIIMADHKSTTYSEIAAGMSDQGSNL